MKDVVVLQMMCICGKNKSWTDNKEDDEGKTVLCKMEGTTKNEMTG